jgi:hypothetical protein
MNNNLNAIFFSIICILLSIGSNFVYKKLLIKYEKRKSQINETVDNDKIINHRINENLFKAYVNGFKKAKIMLLIISVLIILRQFVFKQMFLG